MDLYNRILKLRPDVNPDEFDIQDNSDGNGPFIADWRSTETQPTDADIASVDDSIPNHLALEALRQERNKLLAACDYTQVADYPGVDQAAWIIYRQALRDLPANTTDPDNIDWPVEPS